MSIGEIQCSHFMKKWKKPIILGGLLSIVFIVFFLYNSKILIIKDSATNKEYFLTVPDKKITFMFIHSVHHTPVEEVYNISFFNKLVLEETRFSSLGVGMPFSNEGGTFKNENGKFILKFKREFEKINFRVSPIPQHAVKIGNEIIPLLNFVKAENRIEINASNRLILFWHKN